MIFDAAIVGAGPAGCSCALWLAEYGLRPLLVDRQNAACATLRGLHFSQEWVLGSPRHTLSEIGDGYRAHVGARTDIQKRFNTAPRAFTRLESDLWQVQLDDRTTACARTLVFATGLSPVRPPEFFNPTLMSQTLLDAVSLVDSRPLIAKRRVLLLGGGDNAAENALTLSIQGNAVTIASRQALHAQQRFLREIAACSSVQVRAGQPLPELRRAPDGYLACWADGSESAFDVVAVLFGYLPNREPLELLPAGAGPDDGVFLAGDVSERLHPCVSCAVGEGAHVAWQVERRLAAPQSGGAT